MSKIQLMIEISEEEYNIMKEKKMFGNVTVWKNAICNGIPLPKGHGRIIDESKIKKAKYHWEYQFLKYITDAPTIIEADKEGEDADSD